jgi:hypothetical protein
MHCILPKRDQEQGTKAQLGNASQSGLADFRGKILNQDLR